MRKPLYLVALSLIAVALTLVLKPDPPMVLSSEFPFCSWSGGLANGRPDGWAVGHCVVGLESDNKQDLAPPSVFLVAEKISQESLRRCESGLSEECLCHSEKWVSTSIDQYTTFRGTYERGQRSGEGTFFYSDGRIYIGEWKDDLRHGRGAIYGQNCTVEYSGNWCRGAEGACPT